MLILKSKLLREQITHWAALAAFCAWAVTATVWGCSREEKIVLIAVEPSGARLVTDEKDKVLEAELTNFIKNFLETYYQYDSKSFADQVGKATDLMSESLWKEKQAELLKIQDNLKNTNLVQMIEIQSIDKIDENKYEAQIKIFVKGRISTNQVTLKVAMTISQRERNSKNPYLYEVETLNENSL